MAYSSGDNVKSGFYLNLKEWKVEIISSGGGILPGKSGERYTRIPVFFLFLLAPLLGALFAIFIPFIGVALVLLYLVRLILKKIWSFLKIIFGKG